MKPKSGDTPNLVFVDDGGLTYRPYVHSHVDTDLEYDWGDWMSEMHIGYVFHESVHLFGIYEDRYHPETESPLPGYKDYITADGKGAYVTQPHPNEVREIIDLAVEREQLRTVGQPLVIPGHDAGD